MKTASQRLMQRLTLIAVVLMTVLSLVLVYLLIQATDNHEMSDAGFQRLLVLNGVTAVVLLALIVFIVVRLIQRLRVKKFGSKLLLKLAAIFALVGVLPGVLVYSVSYQFVSRSIETWFDVKVESALEAGLNLGRSTLDNLTSDLSHKTQQALLTSQDFSSLQMMSSLDRIRQHTHADDVQLWTQAGVFLASAGESRFEIRPERPTPASLRRLRMGQPVTAIEGLEEGAKAAKIKIFTAVAPSGFDLLGTSNVLVVMQKLPLTTVNNALAVQSAYSEYQERALARDGLQKMYIGTLTLSLFLAVFGAILLAILLGNQLVRPLLILAKGVEEVAAGNLAPKMATQRDDELSGLTRSFAAMTEQLAQARVLHEREERFKAWSEVAQRVAHEIKNPLTPIQLSAERLVMKLKPKLEAADAQVLQRSVNTIVEQVDAMKRLVNEFRDFARMPAAQLQSLALHEVVQETLLLYEAEIHSAKVTTQWDHNAPLMMGDRQQLRQLVHNLLQNALDATKPQAVQHISIAIEHDHASKTLVLTIQDNGSGFPPDVLARVFEPYVTTKTKGTGLGLAVVYKIVQEHKGVIHASNWTDSLDMTFVKGAKISIHFPLPNTVSADA